MLNTPSSDSGAFTISSGPLALTSPNGEESWALGSKKDITWTPGNATGNVRLDLYKGGTSLDKKVGVIATNVSAAAGKCIWEVGKYIGGTAQVGDDYRIAVSSYTPEMKDFSNSPFTIAKGSIQGSPQPATQGLSLTFPQRGSLLHKGGGYNIKWTTGGFNDTKVKLQLLNIDGAATLMTIGDNLANNGQYFWIVPMSLPDAKTYYKIRIQTMDNAHSDISKTFPIVKANPPPGPPAIKVTAPGGPSQISAAITYPIRWTSTCDTSANGLVDDGFTIDLMDAAGSTKVKTLLDGVASYDGENPDGVHNWHWDWSTSSAQAGKYRIRVTNWSGHCVGMGEQFQTVYPQEHNEYTITPVLHNCCNVEGWCCSGIIDPTNLAQDYLDGAPGLARVGFRFFKNNTKRSAFGDPQGLFLSTILRAKLPMNDKYWYKDKGHVMSAKMRIERKWKMPDNVASYHPYLGGVVMLSQDVACAETHSQNPSNPPSMPGTAVPVNAGLGDVWEVDLTQQYASIVQHNKPDYGFMLYPAVELYQCPGDWCNVTNAESDKVTLIFRFTKDIKP